MSVRQSSPPGATLDLNGLNVYARATEITGTILNGSVTVGPDGGPIAFGIPMPGSIQPVGKVADWTFFGRAGEAITLNFGSWEFTSFCTDPTASLLWNPKTGRRKRQRPGDGGQYNQRSRDNCHDTRVYVTEADGIYHLTVVASGDPTQTGHYTIAVYDATVQNQQLYLNQPVSSTLSNSRLRIVELHRQAWVRRFSFT